MNYDIVYSKRKTLCIEVKKGGSVVVRSPFHVGKKQIENFVFKNTEWINRQIEKRKTVSPIEKDLTEEETDDLKRKSYEIIPEKIEYYSNIMNVFPSHISVNSAKTRFGSCSSENRLNFSCRLMLYPEKAIDYVVVHELAHIRYHNHSKDFWSFVCSVLPDYKERKKLLKRGNYENCNA